MATLRVGSVTPRFVATLSLNPSTVGPQKISIETYTVNGITVDMLPQVNQQVLDSGSLGATMRAIDARVTSANTLEICWLNMGNASITPATSQSISLVCF